MADVPVPRWPNLNVISTFHPESMGQILRAPSTGNGGMFASASGTALAANQIYYHPFVVYETAVAVKMSFIVGATSSGNIDVGIYDNQKNRLVSSGTTAMSASTNTLQEVDITDTTLTPGTYFMAITLSSGTGTFFRLAYSDEASQAFFPVLYETPGGFGLPATAAWASSTDAGPIFVAMGVHFDTLV